MRLYVELLNIRLIIQAVIQLELIQGKPNVRNYYLSLSLIIETDQI